MLDINKRKFIFCCCSLPIYFSTSYLLSDNENFDYLVKGPLAGSIYYTKKKTWKMEKLINISYTNYKNKIKFSRNYYTS